MNTLVGGPISLEPGYRDYRQSVTLPDEELDLYHGDVPRHHGSTVRVLWIRRDRLSSQEFP